MEENREEKQREEENCEEEDGNENNAAVQDDGDEDGGGIDDDPEVMYRDPPDGYLRIRPSQFNFIPGTVFVEYPQELGLIRDDMSQLEKLGKRKLHYTCYWGRNCVKNAFRRAGFLQDLNNWTATWSKHQPSEVLSNLNCLQKVNHFPGSWCVGRKDRLMRTIQAMKRIHGEAYSFHPEGFVLPGDSDQLERAINGIMNSSKKTPLWIMKPVASSCGRGIKVISTEKALAISKTKKKVLIQRYLANPYLINGKKFDLRIYVMVTGTDPLRIYIHKEGLTRISTDDYSLKNTKNKFAHLTNYSVNKKAPHFITASENNLSAALSTAPGPHTSSPSSIQQTDNNDPATTPSVTEIEGFKWSLTAFKQWLSNREGKEKCDEVWKQIDDVIIKTMIAAEPELTHSIYTEVNYRTNCSELFGFDIFLDQSLSPHLIEVNISPSLMGSSPLDRRIKGTLLADYCHVIGFYPHDPQLLTRYSSATTTASSSSSSSNSNPFSLLSLSKDMGQQEKWRKDPSVQNIDMSALVGDSCWMMLCMCEDEFRRADSSFFRLVHPTIETIQSHLPLYKQPRFSDHLLSRYLLDGMSTGKRNLKYFPSKFLSNSNVFKNDSKKLSSENNNDLTLAERPPRRAPSPSPSPSPFSSSALTVTASTSSSSRKSRSHSTGRTRISHGNNSERAHQLLVETQRIQKTQQQQYSQQVSENERRGRCTSAPRSRGKGFMKREEVGGSSTITNSNTHNTHNMIQIPHPLKSEAERKYEERRDKYPQIKESPRPKYPSNGYPMEQKYLPIGALRKKSNSTTMTSSSQAHGLRNRPPSPQIEIQTPPPPLLLHHHPHQQQRQQQQRNNSPRVSSNGIASIDQSTQPPPCPSSSTSRPSFRVLTYGSNAISPHMNHLSYGSETTSFEGSPRSPGPRYPQGSGGGPPPPVPIPIPPKHNNYSSS